MTDEHGAILGVAEIRSRLIAGEPLVVNDVDTSQSQSVLTQSWASVRNYIKGVDYLWYLSKNVFKIRCPQTSAFNQRSMPDKVYLELLPDGYHEELLQKSQMTTRGKIIYTNDADLFWRKPTAQ